MNSERTFVAKRKLKVLVSRDFRDILISQETSIIEQRIITVILTAVKDDQSKFIPKKNPFESLAEKQLSFDDYFQGWAHQGYVEFSVSMDQLNKNRTMKNSSIQAALINMTNINWLRLRDESINGYRAVPFILDPSWNSKNIFFKMDKAVLGSLLNMDPYYTLKKELAFEVSSANTIRCTSSKESVPSLVECFGFSNIVGKNNI